MASSFPLPSSLPGSPRTASPLPLPSDKDHARPNSPSQDDAHTMGAPASTDVARTSPPAQHEVSAPLPDQTVKVTVPKGKEKAAKGPLRLLDLPVDILKEIIHQVRNKIQSQHLAVRHSSGLPTNHDDCDSCRTQTTSLPSASATQPCTASPYHASTRASISSGRTRVPTPSRGPAWMRSHTASLHWSWAMTAFLTKTAQDSKDTTRMYRISLSRHPIQSHDGGSAITTGSSPRSSHWVMGPKPGCRST